MVPIIYSAVGVFAQMSGRIIYLALVYLVDLRIFYSLKIYCRSLCKRQKKMKLNRRSSTINPGVGIFIDNIYFVQSMNSDKHICSGVYERFPL